MNRKALILTATLIAPYGCEPNTSTNPAPQPSAEIQDAAPPVPTDASTILPTEAGPPRRSILTRNPFGNLAHTDNLLFDGDMEMSRGVGQTPWIGIGKGGQTELKLETGGTCRSGLSCLVLTSSNNAVLGRAIAARDKALEFSLWAKVPGNACDAVSVYLIPAMTMSFTLFGKVASETKSPDESGWCRFHGLHPSMNEAIAVYVETSAMFQQRVLLDDAVLRPADGASPSRMRSLPIDKNDYTRIVGDVAPVLRQQWIGPSPRTPRPTLPEPKHSTKHW
jgi:hypothetical protein